MKVTCAVFLAATTFSPTARAQTVLHEQQDSAGFQSSQRWAFELRLGPYRPQIDSEFNGTSSPHQLYFGTKRRLMFQLEGDYQFYRGFGSAAVSVGVGYYRESANAFIERGDASQRSGDITALTLYPAMLGLVYRFDVPLRRFAIPLVPYAKLGLTYTIWSISNGNGDVASFEDQSGGRGRGGTAGWAAGAGLAFLLNVLDPSASRALDGEVGINNTYVFFEIDHFASSGLGRQNVLNVGDDTWFGGLLVEF
jgi:hypothetical protein